MEMKSQDGAADFLFNVFQAVESRILATHGIADRPYCNGHQVEVRQFVLTMVRDHGVVGKLAAIGGVLEQFPNVSRHEVQTVVELMLHRGELLQCTRVLDSAVVAPGRPIGKTALAKAEQVCLISPEESERLGLVRMGNTRDTR